MRREIKMSAQMKVGAKALAPEMTNAAFRGKRMRGIRTLCFAIAVMSIGATFGEDGTQDFDLDLTRQKEIAAHASALFTWPLTNVSFAAAVDRAAGSAGGVRES